MHASKQSLTCPTGSLAGGAGYTMAVTVKASKPGSGTTSATLTSTSKPDADPSDDTASATVSISRR